MKIHIYPLLCLLFLPFWSFAQESDHCSSQHPSNPGNQIPFVQNLGQWDENVYFRAPLGDLNALFLEEKKLTYLFHDLEVSAGLHEAFRDPKCSSYEIPAHAYQVQFLNALNATIQATGEKRAYHNYFIGNDPAKWASKVPLYQKVIYEEIYENIDLEVYSYGPAVKYDFIVAPEADLSPIQMDYQGLDDIFIQDGKLNLITSVDTIFEFQPFAYQFINNELVKVACNYQLNGTVVSFDFPEGYNDQYTLVIDPVVVAATLSGTNGFKNFGHTATFDNGENVYAGGISFGVGYPTTTGAYQIDYAGGYTDMCLSKYNPDGSDLIYATYLGGTMRDFPHSIVTDFNQQLYIYGTSESSDFPTTANGYQQNFGGGFDIVVSKLNADGTALVGSTYMGGFLNDGHNNSSAWYNYGDVYRGEIVLDAQGNAYVASNTMSTDFPTSDNAFQTELNQNGGITDIAQDAVVFKLNSDLSTLYFSTFLGGDKPDTGGGLRVDDFGNVYVTGTAGHDNFPTTSGTIQSDWPGGIESAYVALISANGQEMLLGTFWGTDEVDHGFFMDIDEEDNVHIYGQTVSDEMPITPNTYFFNEGSHQFLAAFTPNLDEVVYSTVIGLGPSSNYYDFCTCGFYGG